ncbi:hypothetical protein QBC46DRAFT_274432, partial [Diplogelasinospora grovesii]
VPDKAWSDMPPGPEIVELEQQRERLKGGQYRIKGRDNEQEIRDLTSTIRNRLVLFICFTVFGCFVCIVSFVRSAGCRFWRAPTRRAIRCLQRGWISPCFSGRRCSASWRNWWASG